MELDTKEILIEARNILTERGWTQGEMARDEAGRPVVASGTSASCFCALGAIRIAIYNLDHGRYFSDRIGYEVEATRALSHALNTDTSGDCRGQIVKWNDDSNNSKERVLRIFDKAIQELDNEDERL